MASLGGGGGEGGTNCELVTNALEIRQYLRIFFYAFSFRFRFRFINFTFTHKYVNNLLTLRSSLSSTFTTLGALSIFFFSISFYLFISGITTNLQRVGLLCCID